MGHSWGYSWIHSQLYPKFGYKNQIMAIWLEIWLLIINNLGAYFQRKPLSSHCPWPASRWDFPRCSSEQSREEACGMTRLSLAILRWTAFFCLFNWNHQIPNCGISQFIAVYRSLFKLQVSHILNIAVLVSLTKTLQLNKHTHAPIQTISWDWHPARSVC